MVGIPCYNSDKTLLIGKSLHPNNRIRIERAGQGCRGANNQVRGHERQHRARGANDAPARAGRLALGLCLSRGLGGGTTAATTAVAVAIAVASAAASVSAAALLQR
mmetsp:Transcript_18344/g.59558  ORF Transcript_18344/g.59558 Transcript_18344/m.59558 type:complete len:106 (-) Transcript_18344:71-388(-)